MKMSTEPTRPGHKRNQDSLNENQAGHLMRTLIYFIFLLYFISVASDEANQEVYLLSLYPVPSSRPAARGDVQLPAAGLHI